MGMTLLLIGFATHRFWVLWMMPESTIITRFREWLGRRHRVLYKAVHCPLCMSLWLSGLMGLAWLYAPWIVWTLAISEAVIIIDLLLRIHQR